MIIVKYCGGLGNQMFQYAMQLVLTKMYGNQEIKGEKYHYFLENEHNGFELTNYFGIDINMATKKEVRKIYNGIIPNALYSKLPLKIKRSILVKYQYIYLNLMNKILKNKSMKVINDEKHNNYVEKIHDLGNGDWYLRGLWQRVDYFEKNRQDILNAFPLKCEISFEEKEIVTKLKNGQYIAVHVRGGDFMNPKFNLCDANYYERAIKEINDENLPLVVFTDDEKYSKKLLEKFNIAYYISHDIDNSIVDMYMLSMAKKVIISNSTFAFWGAYLSEIENQEVICPKYATWDGSCYRLFTQRNFWKVLDNSKKEV